MKRNTIPALSQSEADIIKARRKIERGEKIANRKSDPFYNRRAQRILKRLSGGAK